MPLSQMDLRTLVVRASTITERLEDTFLPDNRQNSDDEVQSRLDAWCQSMARGNWSHFEKRLAWDGLDPVGARRVLGQVQLSEHVPLPAWTKTLQEVLHTVETISTRSNIIDKSNWHFLDSTTPCPFEEIVAPFVIVATQHYVKRAGSTYQLLTDEAQLSLHYHLFQVLTSLSVQALHSEFSSAYRNAYTSIPGDTQEYQMDEHHFYQQFIAQMYQGGLSSFLCKYNVLARLLATTCDFWVEANVEFLQRLAADWQTIQQTFNDELGVVTSIEPALSDSHNGKRTVMALTFASGRKLVYKPKDVGMEESYYHLLRWCNEQGITPPFKILRIVKRPSYGWVEFVAHEPCQDELAVHRYYERVGMLLCLAYLLGAVNCSYEQIINNGEHPILVDADLLMHAYPRPDADQNSIHTPGDDWEQQTYSVLHTGLITHWQKRLIASGKGKDISGFGISSDWESSRQADKQAKKHNQHIALKHGAFRVRERLNALMCDGMQFRVEDYCEAIIVGFQQLYQLLLEQRSALLASDSPLFCFQQQRIRVPYRPRWMYNVILPKLLAPELLRDGVERSILLEQPLQEQDAIPVEYHLWSERNSVQWWSVNVAERQALAQGDLPFLTTGADSTALTVASGQEVTSCFHQPCFDLVLARLHTLNDEDMRRQVGCIEYVLHASGEATQRIASSSIQTSAEWSTTTVPPSEALVTQALYLADDISRQAIEGSDGSVFWLTPRFLQRSQCYQLQPMRYSLFDGICGVAIFLAASARISGEFNYRTLALASMKPLRQLLHNNGERIAHEMGIGGAVGLGSVAYTFTKMSLFLGEPQLLADAKAAARLITAACVADDQALDVIAGSAGAILGLLALYDVCGDKNILERAVICGQHLLQARTKSKAGYLVWPTLGRRHMTGFSHGAAGIAYALLRLYAVTQDVDMLDAAREGLAFEDCAFLREVGNWADELVEGEPVVLTTWCHGAPGIGLARLGGLPVLDTARIHEDIEAALRTTQQVGTRGPDHLCCGNVGRMEFLFTAAQRLGRPELAEIAKHGAWSVITRSQYKGTFCLHNDLPMWVSIPNFFHGLAGIGYTFLRMAEPCTLPSVLLWE